MERSNGSPSPGSEKQISKASPGQKSKREGQGGLKSKSRKVSNENKMNKTRRKVSPGPGLGINALTVPVSKKGKPRSQNSPSTSTPRDSMELVEDTVDRYLSGENVGARRLSKKRRSSKSSGGIRVPIPGTTRFSHGGFKRTHPPSLDSGNDEDDHDHRNSKCSLQKPKQGFNPCIPKSILRISLGSWCVCIGVWHVILSILRLGLSVLWAPVSGPTFPEAVKYDPVLVSGTILLGISGLALIFSVFLRNKTLAMMHFVLITASSGMLLAWSVILLRIEPLSATGAHQGLEYTQIVYCVITLYCGVCSIGWWTQLRAEAANRRSSCLP